jgi:hypothetical protein
MACAPQHEKETSTNVTQVADTGPGEWTRMADTGAHPEISTADVSTVSDATAAYLACVAVDAARRAAPIARQCDTPVPSVVVYTLGTELLLTASFQRHVAPNLPEEIDAAYMLHGHQQPTWRDTSSDDGAVMHALSAFARATAARQCAYAREVGGRQAYVAAYAAMRAVIAEDYPRPGTPLADRVVCSRTGVASRARGIARFVEWPHCEAARYEAGYRLINHMPGLVDPADTHNLAERRVSQMCVELRRRDYMQLEIGVMVVPCDDNRRLRVIYPPKLRSGVWSEGRTEVIASEAAADAAEEAEVSCTRSESYESWAY